MIFFQGVLKAIIEGQPIVFELRNLEIDIIIQYCVNILMKLIQIETWYQYTKKKVNINI